jgi:hypothetical protein
MENSVSPLSAAMRGFEALPEPVRVFLMSPGVQKRRMEFGKKHGLSPAEMASFARVRRDLYDKRIGLADLIASASGALGKKPEEVKPLLLDLLGYELLPLCDHMGDVEGMIRSLGGDPASFPSERIILRAMSPMDVVAEALHEHPVSVPAVLEHRLREVLESRVRNVRKDEETIQRLTRAEKIGGVEMDEEEARGLVQLLAEKVSAIRIAADEPPPPSAEAPEEKEEGSAVSIPVSKPMLHEKAAAIPAFDRRGDGITKEDEHEAEAIRSRMASRIVTSELADMDRAIANAVASLADAHGSSLPADRAARLRSAIASRLRGVRDRPETADILSRDPAKGGVGLDAALSRVLSEDLEKRFSDIHGQKEASVKKEKEVFVKESVESSAAKGASRRLGEQEELDRMYGALTGKRKPITAKPQPVTPPTPSYDKRGGDAPAPPQAQVAPNPYMYKPPTAAPLPAAKTMSDIRPAQAAPQRLIGPVEELRNMTLDDFRRLSADPVLACRKILDKLDLLEEHSFAQRIEGAKAWRESEAQKLYIKIITASFSSGQPIQAIVAAAIGKGELTLTEREVHAIMDMNRQLKA